MFFRALSSVTGRANLKSGSLVLSSIIINFSKFILYFCLSVHFIISINHITSVPYFADELKGERLLCIWITDCSVTHAIIVTGSLASVVTNSSLRILDRPDVRFSLAPASPCAASLVLMVLSAPANTDKRALMRQRMANVTDVKVVFLLGSTGKYQKKLAIEHQRNDDIVQASS